MTTGEPVEPWLLPGLRRVRRWQTGTVSHWQCHHIVLGHVPDGRWVVEHTDTLIGARAYPSEDQARQVADNLMAASGQPWEEVPAEYDSSGDPTAPGWVRRGGSWFRE